MENHKDLNGTKVPPTMKNVKSFAVLFNCWASSRYEIKTDYYVWEFRFEEISEHEYSYNHV